MRILTTSKGAETSRLKRPAPAPPNMDDRQSPFGMWRYSVTAPLFNIPAATEISIAGEEGAGKESRREEGDDDLYYRVWWPTTTTTFSFFLSIIFYLNFYYWPFFYYFIAATRVALIDIWPMLYGLC